MSKIIYTHTDEAPALATHSFLPIVKGFAKAAGVDLETRDISLAGRIISQFPDFLEESQKQSDDLAELGELVKEPEANIIKLPNISASIPQLKAAIKELQGQGYKLPDFPEDPQTETDKDVRARYAKVLGSAVNPVLREGNSDRRVAGPVKEYAQKNPHSMGKWSSDSKTHVASMSDGDFFGSEKSAVAAKEGHVTISFVGKDGTKKALRDTVKLERDEVIDAAVMSCKKLQAYFQENIAEAKDQGLLLSLHMKATMMKVSDPIIFGHCVKQFYADVFSKYANEIAEIGVNPNNGIGDLYNKLPQLPQDKQDAIKKDIEAIYGKNPGLAMVDSDRGITNLHVPSDVIIDASMPAAIRSSGMMWNAEGKLQDTKALIPDRSYSGVYQKTIEFCQKNGAFDPSTMGNVSNVGLMARKAEEYGSHDKTFELAEDGKVVVEDQDGNLVFEHAVESGDIWRMCQTKDEPIRDWVRLAIHRARSTGNPVVFWLNKDRAHDANLIAKVEKYLPDHDTTGLEVKVLSPIDATAFSLERIKKGEDTISATGNVLRDYLTDLFPILELGTSAKMLSIVPLLKGGGLYETGAGGSAPKHVQQFVEEGHLRWDSLGEFLALAVSLEELGEKTKNPKAKILGECLSLATSKVLNNGKSPLRKVGQLDNRGSHYFLATYWADAVAAQGQDSDLQGKFKEIAQSMSQHETKILEEIDKTQGVAVDIGGYFRPDHEKVSKAMRPSATLNSIIDSLQ